MFGYSVYLTGFEETSSQWKDGEVCFTSFHISEEFSDTYAEQAKTLLKELKQAGKKIIADISPRGVAELGYGSLDEFAKDSGVDTVRCDYGFTLEEMLRAAKHASLGVNASTADVGDIMTLLDAGADIVALHNFYPRPETGLDEEFLTEKNKMLHELGVKTAVFISGDARRRGPLFEGLPTLEKHRDMPPYVQYMQMERMYGADIVLVGDPGLSSGQNALIKASESDGILRLPVMLDEEYHGLYGKVFTNRVDSPRWIARLMESREYATAGKRVSPGVYTERLPGCVTIDNERYLRYSGEIQIVKEPLPADERVNVIGWLEEGCEGLLTILERGTKLMFTDPGKEIL